MRTDRKLKKEQKEFRKNREGLLKVLVAARTVATPDELVAIDAIEQATNEATLDDREAFDAVWAEHKSVFDFVTRKYDISQTDAFKYVNAHALPGEGDAWFRNQLGIGDDAQKARDLQVVQAFLARQPQQVQNQRSGWFIVW